MKSIFIGIDTFNFIYHQGLIPHYMHDSPSQLISPSYQNIVIIGYVWPEPKSSAAGSRMMQLISYFKERACQVIFASPAALGEHRTQLADIGVLEQAITLNSDSFDVWIKEINPDLVLFDRFMMEEQFGWRVEQQCPQCIRILDTEDLHSLRLARHTNLKQVIANGGEFDTNFADSAKLYTNMQSQDVCQREISAIYRCDLSLMISSFEIDLLTTQFSLPQQLLLHLPFMLEPLTYKEQKNALPSFQDRQHFVTIGNFRHAPNWDSVLWLKKDIWPKIRAALPSAQLHIYGAYPAKKVTDLHNPKQGFYIEGWADSAVDVLKNARICLSPLRFGAGIKGKFTDAMQTLTPSVTTAVGIEAMTADKAWPGKVANTSQSISEAAIELYQSALLWQRASERCDDIIDSCYNKKELSLQLDLALLNLQHNLAAFRAANFTGTMLRHHHHKSTKYMAQWIEAKNNSCC